MLRPTHTTPPFPARIFHAKFPHSLASRTYPPSRATTFKVNIYEETRGRPLLHFRSRLPLHSCRLEAVGFSSYFHAHQSPSARHSPPATRHFPPTAFARAHTSYHTPYIGVFALSPALCFGYASYTENTRGGHPIFASSPVTNHVLLPVGSSSSFHESRVTSHKSRVTSHASPTELFPTPIRTHSPRRLP